MKYTGIGVALAWPETRCKGAGAWYDGLMRRLNICDEAYFYPVGHAALLLINRADGSVYYFDFGRYGVTETGYGRVRDAHSDRGLAIAEKAQFDAEGQCLNLPSILLGVSQCEACSVVGPLLAAALPLSFQSAYQQAKSLQARELIPYGPFVWNGTNCSRFVRTVLLAGRPSSSQRLRLLFPPTLTPTPRYLVNAVGKGWRFPAVFPAASSLSRQV